MSSRFDIWISSLRPLAGGLALKLAGLALLVGLTNFGFQERVQLLLAQGRLTTLAFYVGVWLISLAALLVAALHPSARVRWAWALPLSLSGAAAFLFMRIADNHLSVFDMLSFLTVMHEADRAADFYGGYLPEAMAVFIGGLLVLGAPVRLPLAWPRKLLCRLWWTPALPVALIAAIVLLKEGGGTQAMPAQFQPLAVASVAAAKAALHEIPARDAVRLRPSRPPAARHVVLIVDESVRADYLFWRPGNPYTPALAANGARIVNFGPAASGGNCSSYSNALLRMGADMRDISGSVRRNPFIWQYARKAGFRTVYIDGQSGLNKDPGLLQNFMTPEETAWIDRFVRFSALPAWRLDEEVLKVIHEELKNATGPVFIYANKNGAHFPYDETYPPRRVLFSPTITQAGEDNTETRVRSYLNAINWSVDTFFAHLFDTLNLRDTAIIYTSDHGQTLADGATPHCIIDNPDPRQALVPLLAITGNDDLNRRFVSGARLNSGRATHFLVYPTLLELMGYDPRKVAERHGPSMFRQGPRNVFFTSGDIFGIFRREVNRWPIDLSRDWRELNPLPRPAPAPLRAASGKGGG